MRVKRITLEPGIYQDAYGYSVRVSVGTGPARRYSKEHRFPLDTDRAVLRARHADERARLLRDQLKNPQHATRGSIAADVLAYFRIATLTTKTAADRRRHFDWLIAAFPNRRRDTLEHGELRAALNTLWTRPTKGKPSRPASASLKNDHRTAISHLFTTLDGKNAHNPVRDIPKYDEPPAAMRAVPYELIDLILEEIRDTGNAKGQDRPPSKTKARLRALAYVALTLAQLSALAPSDVNWIARTVTIPARKKGRKKGARAFPVEKPLTDDGFDALRAFDRAGCWTHEPTTPKASKSSIWKTFTAARDKMIARLRDERPDLIPLLESPAVRTMNVYSLRHSYATFALRKTKSLDATQALLDHADKRTTLRYSQGAIAELLQDAGAAIGAAHAARRPPVTH